MAELSPEETTIAYRRPQGHRAGPLGVVEELSRSGRPLALFLDFDGTLVDIVTHHDAVVVPPGLPDLLARLSARLGGALAVVTGRALADVDRYLDPLLLPGCGQHGLELRRHDQSITSAGSPALLDDARTSAGELPGRIPGVHLEDKGLTIALHYRERPDAKADVIAFAEATAAAAGLAVRRGKRVVEVGLGGASKGTALAELMREPPFADRMPVAVGDDFTDEAAFRAAQARGGLAIAVGERVARSADLVLDNPTAVRSVLEALAGADKASGLGRSGS